VIQVGKRLAPNRRMQAAQKLPRRLPIPHLSVVPSLVDSPRLAPPRPVPRPKAQPLIAVAEMDGLRVHAVEELSSLDLEDEADTEVVGEPPAETRSASPPEQASAAGPAPVKSQSILVVRSDSPKVYAIAAALVTLRLLILAGRALRRRLGEASSFVGAEWTRALGDARRA
jgi:hypothetical protein